MQYTGPSALNEGIKAIGESFSPETAISRQQAVMAKQQYEMTMKPITLDEIASKTAPDLWGPMQKLAETSGIVEEHNGTRFIRAGNLKQFHEELGKNNVWKAQLADESAKINQARIDELGAQLKPVQAEYQKSIAKIQWDMEQEVNKAKEEQRPVDYEKMMKFQDKIKEVQGSLPHYKQMTQLQQQIESTMGSYKKRITQLGLIDEGFKKDVEKYGQDEAVKIALYGGEYRRKLDLDVKKAEFDAKLEDAVLLERAKAGLKPDKAPTIKSVDRGNVVDIYKDGVFVETKPKGKLAGVGDSEDKASKAKEKEKNNVIAKLRAFQLKNYTIPNKSGNLTPGQIKANEDESMKVEQLIAQVQSDEVAPNKIDWPTVMKDGRLVRKSSAEPAKKDWTSIVGEAKSAIARGADRGAVLKRLKDMGYNGSI